MANIIHLPIVPGGTETFCGTTGGDNGTHTTSNCRACSEAFDHYVIWLEKRLERG